MESDYNDHMSTATLLVVDDEPNIAFSIQQSLESDVLRVNFTQLATTLQTPKLRVVGNLPYNISSPLLFHLVQAAGLIDEQVFMLQAEVVERMVAPAASSEFSRLSVMLQARYDMELVLEVPPEAFEPAPKVDSAVVRMIPKRDFHLTSSQWNALEQVVAAAFSQRRKMLRTNLQAFAERLKLSEEELKSRAQDISVDRYIEWAKVIAQ